MCGIVGFTGPSDIQLLRRMADLVAHRGPDGEGFASAPEGRACVHFGHRRLVVLDREGGRQPMATADGRWLITFNGEIYNHVDLRRRLSDDGVAFRTRSDTEVLLQALAQWGEEALPLLDGMFAFAAFDAHDRKLLLAVDRFGQKPLVWTLVGEGLLVFASELTAVRAHPQTSQDWDLLGLCRALAFGAPPAPGTILRGVQRLDPGTVLVVGLDPLGRTTGRRLARWWQPTFGPRSSTGARPDALVGALRESVRKHLVADVPVGILLSGGVDSTVVAAAAVAERPVTSLSMGFGEGAYDESASARETARLLGTHHHEFRLTPREAVETLESVTAHLDEPLADAGCLPAWELYRQARARVTVAVGGDGGDELLEGYPTFRALQLSRRLGFLGRGPLAAALRRLAQAIPIGEGYYPFGYQARRFMEGLAAAPWFRLIVFTGGCGLTTLRRLVRPEVLAEAELLGPDAEAAERLYAPALPEELRREVKALDPRDADVWDHLRSFLAGQVLRKVDRMSMAHGLEVRAPMLGSPFAEACLAAAPRLRRQGSAGKLPLRRWLAASPLAHTSHGPKRGFAIPVARWLRNELREVAESVFLDPLSPLASWCDAERLAELWRRHRDGRDDLRKELWALLSLGLWLRHHQRAPAPAVSVTEHPAHAC